MAILDDELLTYIKEHPGARVQRICEHFQIPWPARPDEPNYRYGAEAATLRRQLQRLRKTGKIASQGGLWRIV